MEIQIFVGGHGKRYGHDTDSWRREADSSWQDIDKIYFGYVERGRTAPVLDPKRQVNLLGNMKPL